MTRFPHPTTIGIAALIAIVSCVGFGCVNNTHAQQSQSLPTAFATEDELKPANLPYEEANLVLAGTQVPVVMDELREEGRLTFNLRTHGATVESETYVFDKTGFRFAEGTGERYDPPIPLVRYPVKAGEVWKWKGKIIQGGVTYGGQADISAETYTLNMASGQFESLQVLVELKIDAGSPEAAERNLKFWFVPQRGLMRREFGASSIREPRPETSEDES